MGTSHFESETAAVKYYTPYEDSVKDARAAVETKLKEGEIHIGKPALKEGEKLVLNKEEGRYFIQEAPAKSE